MSDKKTDKQADLQTLMLDIGAKARAAARQLAISQTSVKNQALQNAANELRAAASDILKANAEDMKLAQAEGVNQARLDRIKIGRAHV